MLAELGFLCGHLAAVRFMIETGEMKEAVEKKDLDLRACGMAVLSRLASCSVVGDREVTSVGSHERFHCGETEYVCGFVLAAVFAIQLAKAAIGGEEHVDNTGEFHGQPSLPQKTPKACSRKTQRLPGVSVRRETSWRLKGDHA